MRISRRRFGWLSAWLMFSLATASAFGQRVKVQFEPGTDFSHVHSYQWRTHPVYEKNPQLQETYAVAGQLIMSEGNRQLMKQGLQPADASPDVFITFLVQAQAGESTRVVDIGPWYGGGYGWYAPATWTTETDSYLDGVIMIDIVDAHTSKPLWHAFCGDKIRDMSTRDKNITSAVRKALEKFPPKQKK
jgi:hypothetical protein